MHVRSLTLYIFLNVKSATIDHCKDNSWTLLSQGWVELNVSRYRLPDSVWLERTVQLLSK